MTKPLIVAALGKPSNIENKIGVPSILKFIEIHWVNSWIDLAEIENIDVLLVTLEWLPKWRTTILEAQKNGIPCYYLIDGVVEWDYLWRNWEYIKVSGTAFQPLLSNRIGVIGYQQARILSMLGLENKIDYIGIPRFDSKKSYRFTNELTTYKILVTTANTPSLNAAGDAYVLNAIKELRDYFNSQKTVEVKWRIGHQYAKKLNLPANDDKMSIDDEIASVSGVISFASTVLLESMLFEKPTALIDFRQVPSLLQSAWTIKCKTDIPIVVRELIHPPSEKLAYQTFCLNEQLFYKNATNRLADSLFKLCNKSSPYTQTELSTTQTIQKIDFNQVHSQITSFSIGDLTTLQYSFDAYRSEAINNRKTLNIILKKIDAFINSPLGRGLKKLDKIPFLRTSYDFIYGLKIFISTHL
ncbi:hypothetical protein OAV71_04065 [Opitutales bacterium]|nr:hypothetical protein [Opitutales bacterium]